MITCLAQRRTGAATDVYDVRTKKNVTDVTNATDTADVPEVTDPAVGSDQESTDEPVMSMLQEHVPLSLLCDLTAPEGPESAEILAEEGEPDTRWWEQ